MKCNKTMYLVISILVYCTVCILGVASTSFSQPRDYGVILVAHKATHQPWNRRLKDLHEAVFSHFNPGHEYPPDDPGVIDIPIELAFLNFENLGAPRILDGEAVNRLVQNYNKRQILIVYLSHSSFVINDKILQEVQAIANTYLSQSSLQIQQTIRVVIAPAMDDQPPAVTMLQQFVENWAADISGPKSLVLVSYGPHEPAKNRIVLDQLGCIGDAIGNAVPLQNVVCYTLRPHFPPNPVDTNAPVVEELRNQILELQETSKVIVVPYVFQGDFLKELKFYLRGQKLKKTICQEEIISHQETKDWVIGVIGDGMSQPPPLSPPPCPNYPTY